MLAQHWTGGCHYATASTRLTHRQIKDPAQPEKSPPDHRGECRHRTVSSEPYNCSTPTSILGTCIVLAPARRLTAIGCAKLAFSYVCFLFGNELVSKLFPST